MLALHFAQFLIVALAPAAFASPAKRKCLHIKLISSLTIDDVFAGQHLAPGPVVFPIEYEAWEGYAPIGCSGSSTTSGKFIVGQCADLAAYSVKLTAQIPAGKSINTSTKMGNIHTYALLE